MGCRTNTLMMEASSPLAAMQPPSFMGHYGFPADTAPSYASFATSNNFGPNSFNFKDLSMKKSQSDYFNRRPVRGSSPTASLAADLSQNFHIDQSPQLPTPRRALFANNFFNGSNHGKLTTPPIPSSSPGPASDGMDISPLPHKIPFSSSFSVQLQSPTPDLTPADSSTLSIPSPPLSDALPEALVLTFPQDKKKFGPLRPGLSRPKGMSTGNIPQRPSAESQLPPFKFGNGIWKHPTSSSLSLSEIFVESPTQEKSLKQLPAMPPPRSKPAFALSSNLRMGSPAGGHMRKSSNPMVRPRKQFRRSLSMFEHPEDVVKEERCAPSLPPIMDVEPAHIPQLPNFISQDQPGDLPRISRETLVEVLEGRFNHVYEKLVIIDCRFEYEYNGGHINGAVNFNDKDKLAARLFEVEPTSRALLVFHCEYSAHRAPIMAKFVRNKDRAINAERYPALTYPEAYILDGGYSSFFKGFRSRCFPQNYVEMDAKEHARACEMGLGKVKQRSKLVRAQTFAFGQHSPSIDSSPTAMGRGCRDADVEMDLGSDIPTYSFVRPALDSSRSHTRRMFSY